MTDPFGAALVEALPALGRFALKLTRDRDAAEDLTQDTVTNALAARANWHGSADSVFLSWLFKIAQNTWYTDRKTNTHRLERQFEFASRNESITSEAESEVLVAVRDVSRALDGLPESFREVLWYVTLHGGTRIEQAEALDITTTVLWSRLNRGREQLRQRLYA
jgi:RNA polymerase sigma-70 factor (ECF subfamily)